MLKHVDVMPSVTLMLKVGSIWNRLDAENMPWRSLYRRKIPLRRVAILLRWNVNNPKIKVPSLARTEAGLNEAIDVIGREDNKRT